MTRYDRSYNEMTRNTELIFFLPCLSIIKLENYNLGQWSQMMNKVFYILLKEQCILQMNSTDNTALLTVLLAKHITSCDLYKSYPYTKPASYILSLKN
jgi:hypothetical protein